MEAILAQSRLAAAGIPSWIPDSCFAGICWHYAKAIGGIRLQVSAEDAEDAAAILDEPPLAVEEPTLRGTEALADRTLRAAVFGSVVQFPVGLYAGWLLVRLLTTGEPPRDRARRQAVHAAVLLILVFGPVLALSLLAVGRALQ
jgi:hypothetical protein